MVDDKRTNKTPASCVDATAAAAHEGEKSENERRTRKEYVVMCMCV